MSSAIASPWSDAADGSDAAPQPCSVAVIYDDAVSRGRAIELCDRLIHHFWQDLQFRVNWWKAAHLDDADIAPAAAWSVRHAQIVIFSAVNRSELPAAHQTWLQAALANPAADGRMLVGFANSAPGQTGAASPLLHTLQSCALLAGMDFLPRLTPGLDVLAGAAQHAHDATGMTSVLSSILHQSLPAPRL